MVADQRMGQKLIQAGMISEKQLSSALERQMLMGGRLGTNLLELGFVSETALVEFLGKLYNVPPVKISELEEISPEITKLISKEIAKKHQAVPFHRERKVIKMVMANPHDLEALQELQFITGSVIKPHLASEVRLLYALERYYQIERHLRYVSVLDEERKQFEAEEKAPVKKEATAEELDAALEEAKREWVEVKDRDKAIATFLKTVHVGLPRVAMFLVRSGNISGWRGFPSSRQSEIIKLLYKLQDLPHFNTVASSKNFYQGPLSSSPHYESLYNALGGGAPKQALIVPIMIGENVVAILYGDNQDSGMPSFTHQFVLKAARKLKLVLEILILRKKILES